MKILLLLPQSQTRQPEKFHHDVSPEELLSPLIFPSVQLKSIPEVVKKDIFFPRCPGVCKLKQAWRTEPGGKTHEV